MVFNVSESEWVIGSAQPATTARRLPLRLGRLADERLAQLVKAGRERAFAVLYERYHQALYRYCRSMLRNDQDAQDALQSTFASALAALQEGAKRSVSAVGVPDRPQRGGHRDQASPRRRARDIRFDAFACGVRLPEEADNPCTHGFADGRSGTTSRTPAGRPADARAERSVAREFLSHWRRRPRLPSRRSSTPVPR